MNPTFRPYVSGQDEQLYVDIYNRAWREDEDFAPDTVEDAKRWDDAPWLGARLRLIAEADGVPVAAVNAETDKTTTDRKGYLGGPHVVPEHRRKGIGETLLRALISEARQQGFHALSLSVAPHNRSRMMYERTGFEKVGEEGDSWTMLLRLA